MGKGGAGAPAAPFPLRASRGINKVQTFLRYLSQRVLDDRWGSLKFLQWFTQILAQHSNDKTVLRIIQRRTKRRQTTGKIEVWNCNDPNREEMNEIKTCQAYLCSRSKGQVIQVDIKGKIVKSAFNKLLVFVSSRTWDLNERLEPIYSQTQSHVKIWAIKAQTININ